MDDPVETWPVEALETAMDRGGLQEWRRIAAAIRRQPWGPVAESVGSILTYSRPYGVDLLLERVIATARAGDGSDPARSPARWGAGPSLR